MKTEGLPSIITTIEFSTILKFSCVMYLNLWVIYNISSLSFNVINNLIYKSNNNKSGSYVGVGIMGSLSALIVGPCVTAPLIGALVYIASTNNYIIGATALFSLGIGMGLPLLVLGTSATKLMKLHYLIAISCHFHVFSK